MESPRYPRHDVEETFASSESGVGPTRSTGIGVGIFKAFLSGGAHVIVTTSCCSQVGAKKDQGGFFFHGFGSRDSALTAVLFIKAGLQAEW